MSISTAPQFDASLQQLDYHPSAPETLLVAGIRDANSLGWVTARNWLEEVPDGKIVATYRSAEAQRFLGSQTDVYQGRISGLEIDWLAKHSSNTLALLLRMIDRRSEKETGFGLNITGVAHCVAAADRTNFTNDPTEIEEHVFIDAFRASTLSLQGLVKASKQYMAPNAGIVTFGYGDPEKTEKGYGGAMQLAKAGLTKTVMVLAEELGKGNDISTGPLARIAEIVTGYIPTRSGKGVAILQKTKPRDAEAKSSESALLHGTNGALQAEAAGALAILFMRHPAFRQTTGQRLFVDGGASVRSATRIT